MHVKLILVVTANRFNFRQCLFFIFWHPVNTFLNTVSGPNAAIDTEIPDDEVPDDKFESIDSNDITKRKWALDSGLSYQYFNKDIIKESTRLSDLKTID